MSQKLNTWTLYQNTKDFPGQFVARRFELDKPTSDHFADSNVERVRQWIYEEAVKSGQGEPYCLPRQSQDDPVVMETWI
jgi:hypothetical protein